MWLEKATKYILEAAPFWVPPLVGGVVDFANQVNLKKRPFTIRSFVVHILSAMFFGWIAGTVAAESMLSQDLIAVAGGTGGYLGVRLADLAITVVMRR